MIDEVQEVPENNIQDSTVAPETQTTDQPEIPELDSLEKVRLGGTEWSLKDLQSSIMRQADYTRKTQELAEQRKTFEEESRFYSALPTDLKALRESNYRADLVEQFKKVYPEKFHAYLGDLPQQPNDKPTLPQDVLDDLKEWREIKQEKLIEANLAEIDANLEKFSPKFPYADHEVVLSRAQMLLDKKQQENPKARLDANDWENLFKVTNDAFEKRYKEFQSKQFNKQTTANQKGRDVGPGGGIPGQAPPKFKTVKEGVNAFLESVGG